MRSELDRNLSRLRESGHSDDAARAICKASEALGELGRGATSDQANKFISAFTEAYDSLKDNLAEATQYADKKVFGKPGAPATPEDKRKAAADAYKALHSKKGKGGLDK